jgi:SAM-dependent methyltransferase
VERDDGFIIVTDGPADHVATYDSWPHVEQQAMDFVQGPVLHVGCGAGRGALELQRRGHEVVAIDVSPGAIDVCRNRGVRDARVLGIEDIGRELGVFDTILLLGVNFGLLQNEAKAAECFRRFAGVELDDVPRFGPPALGRHSREARFGRVACVSSKLNSRPRTSTGQSLGSLSIAGLDVQYVVSLERAAALTAHHLYHTTTDPMLVAEAPGGAGGRPDTRQELEANVLIRSIPHIIQFRAVNGRRAVLARFLCGCCAVLTVTT